MYMGILRPGTCRKPLVSKAPGAGALQGKSSSSSWHVSDVPSTGSTCVGVSVSLQGVKLSLETLNYPSAAVALL